ncbi:MAG: glycosyltransferase family 39 protein [Spirosomaceae bacterium]|nr:glycosyltransferase family 39 protein [Spirosomataceae bacterium]
MLVLLLLLSGILLFAYFVQIGKPLDIFTNLRLALVKTLLAGGMLTYLSTELLSFFNLLNTSAIAAFWGLVVLAVAWGCWQTGSQLIAVTARAAPPQNASDSTNTRVRAYLWGVVIVYLLPLLFLAIYAPPNNTDSVNYHLARVVFWLQNQNVEHYPTVYIQQLYHNVFSEYILLHVMALSGWEDYVVNLVQYVAMLGSVAVVSLLAQQLGLNTRLQVLVGVLQLTLPIGILESTTTQNDYLANFLFLAFLYFGLQLMQKSTPYVQAMLWMAVALALGGLAKYTVLLFGLPVCVWIGVVCLRTRPFSQSVQILVVTSLTLVLVFGPFFKRNYDLFDNVLGAAAGSPLFTEEVATERVSPATVVSGVVKNIALHLGLPNQAYNQAIDRAVGSLHEWLKVPLDDPQLIFDKYYTRFIIQEDMSGNPWHFVLIMSALIMLWVKGFWRLKRRDQYSEMLILSLCAVVGFVIYCALIKFQFYNSRTQMPFFSMGFLWTAFVLKKIPQKWLNTLMLVFLVAGLPYIFTNYNKTLLPLRQVSKYVLGYVPKYLCISAKAEEVQYQKQFGTVYDFSHADPCFPLTQTLSYTERLRLIGQLAAAGYYKSDEKSVLGQSRLQNYFTELHDTGLYDDLQLLASKLSPDTRGIAVLQANVLGFYREWLVFKNHLRRPVPMQYILYHQKCLDAPNARPDFEYDYILINHEGLIEKYLNRAEIEEITKTKNYILVKLKRPSTQQYPYADYAEIQAFETRR